MSRCARRLGVRGPAALSSLPVGCAAPPLAKLEGLSRSRPSLNPAPAHRQWPRTRRPATGARGRGLRPCLWRDPGPGAAAAESWPQRKGALGHTRGPTRRTYRPTADRRAWAGPGVGGGTCGGAGAVGAVETRPRSQASYLRPRGPRDPAAPGTSGEGPNLAGRQVLSSLGVRSAAGVPPLGALPRDSGDRPVLSPTSSPAGAESSAEECAEPEAVSIPRGSRRTRESHREEL